MSAKPRRTLEPAAVRKPTPTTITSGCSQMAGLYDLAETLGKGHFAVVKSARHVFTGEKVAVKVIDKAKLDANHQKSLLKEVLCMKLVQHPHVVRLYEVIDTSTKLYLVLELGYGDLYDLIQRQQGGLVEDLARKYFCQILSAVSYCHKLYVVHRDLKPENVVFFPNSDGGLVKLTDFGFSNNYSPGVKLATSCGSLAYSAPEILLGDPYDAVAIDIWSLGVILFMLVAGRAPFQEANDSETLTMIMDVKYSIPTHVTSQACKELIKGMLVRGPENRASLSQIENHKWVQEGGYAELSSQNPLISDHRLTPDERNMIICQMECGQIAKREKILESLQSNAYNHITSTFYLLAEKLLRERKSVPGNSSSAALTSSLESLHERRKNSGGPSHSGTSDTDEGVPSETDDSLAPLDLEMKNASAATTLAVGKKAGRILGPLNPASTLTDLEKGLQLPVVEETEDSAGRGEEDDNAGPLPPSSLPSSTSHRRRTPYHHRRVIIPQRSASCSSSEDEDSEKKKRGARTKIKVKHSECLTKKIFDDESSDEQGNNGRGASSGNPTQSHHSYSHSSKSTNTTAGQSNSSSRSRDTSSECSSWNQRIGESIITITPAFDEDYDDNGIGAVGLDVPEEIGSPTISNHEHLLTPNSYKNGYASDTDRHSCSDLAYAIEVNDESSRPNEHPPTALSFAKKGKKLLFSWFFLKKKSKTHSNQSNSSTNGTAPSTSVGIYKTKSFAELKLRSFGGGGGGSSSGQSSKSTATNNSMDVNMNL